MTRIRQFFITIATSTMLLGFASAADISDAKLRADLQRVAAMRIYFGHQSVGGNILDGIRQLAARTGVPLRIAEASSASEVGAATFAHTFVAENRNPFGKLKAFELAIGSKPSGLDVAMVKFCYLDFTTDTDARTLFSIYRAMMNNLHLRNPNTIWIHITAPLTAIQTGPKAFIKNILGITPYGVLENQRREEYNTLLRHAYAGREPIFDLARFESTTEQGRNVTVEWHGQSIPALANDYSDDGGHLNSIGRLHVATELLSLIASLPAK